MANDRKEPRFDDEQIGFFCVGPSGAWSTANKMGLGVELNEVGKVEMRRIWVEFPEKRGLFDEPPPCLGTGVMPPKNEGPGTINSDDPDVAQVAAVLADACHAGGLSEGHYRAGDDALARLAARLQAPGEPTP